ncbi:MAG: flagellar biosynthetic protein FliR [Lachnospiraceae bacterium]|nr:flagellar biosynthetic protein FliR [Lachnospiraceae bacterium]
MLTYETYFAQWEEFLLIFSRMASFIYVAPFFNTSNVPRKTKLGFGLFTAVIVLMVLPDQDYTYSGTLGYAALVAEEVFIGLILGAGCNLTMQIIHFAGRFIDMDIGLSMASVMDPTNRTQNGIVGTIYYYMILLILIVSGLHQYLIAAIVESFRWIPIGHVTIHPSLYTTVVNFMGDYFSIGFRITLPVFASMLLVNCLLAILAKVAPQMNMFVVGMQLKIIIGLLVLVATIYLLPVISNFLYEEMKYLLYELVNDMAPPAP